MSENIEARAISVAEQARVMRIASESDCARAIELGRAIKDLRAEAEAHYRPVIQAALDAHRRALEAFRSVDEPLRQAEIAVKRAIAEWRQRVEAERAEAERRMREQLEHLRAEAIERRIEAMEAAGATAEEIAAIIRREEASAVVIPSASPAKQDGFSVRRMYRAQVTSLIELVRWVAEHPTYENLLAPNQSALNALARARGGTLDIPGVRIVVEESVALRR